MSAIRFMLNMAVIVSAFVLTPGFLGALFGSIWFEADPLASALLASGITVLFGGAVAAVMASAIED